MGRTLGNSFLCFSKTAQFICGTTSMLCEKEIFFLFAEFGMTCLHSLPIIYQSRGFPHSPPRLSIFAPRKYSECSSMSALRKKKGKKERKRGRNKKQPKNALQKRVPEFSTTTTTSCTISHPLYYEQALRMLPLLRKEHPAKNTLDRLPAMLDGGE